MNSIGTAQQQAGPRYARVGTRSRGAVAVMPSPEGAVADLVVVLQKARRRWRQMRRSAARAAGAAIEFMRARPGTPNPLGQGAGQLGVSPR